MVMPGNNGDLAVTVATTKSPSRRSCTAAPSGAMRLRCAGCRTVVTTRREAGRLTRRVDASDLHRHRGEPRHAQDEHDDQGSDRERRLDGDTAGRAGNPTPAGLIG